MSNQPNWNVLPPVSQPVKNMSGYPVPGQVTDGSAMNINQPHMTNGPPVPSTQMNNAMNNPIQPIHSSLSPGQPAPVNYNPPGGTSLSPPEQQMMRSNSDPNLPPGAKPSSLVNGHNISLPTTLPANTAFSTPPVMNGPRAPLPAGQSHSFTGPIGQRPPMMGPNGQVLNKAVSSPPNTGPIATAPLPHEHGYRPPYPQLPHNASIRPPHPYGIQHSSASGDPTRPPVPSPGQPLGPVPTGTHHPGGIPQTEFTSFPPSSLPGAQPPPPRPPMNSGQLPGAMMGGPPQPHPSTMGYRPPGVPQMNSHQPGSERPTLPSLELPVPYHGQAQYSSQVHQWPDQNASGLVTPGSEPASQRSSRGPSPVPGQKFDALEGQFSSTPVTPGTVTPNRAPPGPNFPPMPPQPGGGGGGGGGGNPMYAPPGPMMMNQGGVVPLPGTQHPQPPVSNQMGPGNYAPPTSNTQPMVPPGPPVMPGMMGGGAGVVPGGVNAPPPTHPGGITGKRVYPNMPMPTYPQPGVAGGGPSATPPPPHMMGGPAPGTAGFNAPMTYPPQPNMAPQPGMGGPGPGPAPTMGPGPMTGAGQNYMNSNNVPNSSANSMVNNFSNMNIQPDSTRPINLLQEKTVIPAKGVEISLPNLPADYKKVNCNPDVFRCTLNAIPSTQSLLNKSRLPLGILIHPFKDLSQLPVIQSSVIVRCRSCRTYINPFVSFMDARRWKCNLCYRVNELPEEFSYDPVSKTYGEPQRRPEIRSATIEFIAPSEYMLRPPQPAVYLYVLDVSFNAMETGYLELFCQTLLDEFDRIPGDSRAQIGFITFDTSLHFYNLSEGLSQPQMMIVSDVEDVFLPVPDGLLANLGESKELVTELLTSLPEMFKGNMETGSALGSALQAGYKLLSSTGGRISVFQTQLPTVGPGSLKNREDTNERTGKKIQHLGPAIDFYKKLSLDCSALQIAVDTFMLNSQFADLATVAGISKYSGGSFNYFPGLHTRLNPSECERFESVLKRYLTRKIGFEAVMRIRCSRGMSIHTFHGNFFVRSTDLLSLPNINPDAAFGMQMSIEDTIESNYVSFQAALLYTSSKGERRIRVHSLCIPVTNSITEVFTNADQVGICNLLSKMAVDKSLTQSMQDARDALVNSCVDMLSAYGNTLTSSQRMGQLPCPYSLRLMPLYVLSLLKYAAFRVGVVTKLDDRVHALESCKSIPISHFLLEPYPNLYPVHNLDDTGSLSKGDMTVPQPELLQLSAGNIDRHGAYLMDLGSRMYLWLGAAISDKFCQEVLDMPTFQNVPEGLSELPELDNSTSERLRTFVGYLNDQRPFQASFHIIREDSRLRLQFLQYLVDDRSESTMSYYEFLQHLQKEVK